MQTIAKNGFVSINLAIKKAKMPEIEEEKINTNIIQTLKPPAKRKMFK
jgi:hypothetical protein